MADFVEVTLGPFWILFVALAAKYDSLDTPYVTLESTASNVAVPYLLSS